MFRMTRDIEFIREIMLLLEKELKGVEPVTGITEEGKTLMEVADHVQQLEESGLIEASIVEDGNGMPYAFCIRRITSAGHDFLQYAKNDSIWKKVIGEIKKQAIPATIGVALAMMKQRVTEMLNLPKE